MGKFNDFLLSFPKSERRLWSLMFKLTNTFFLICIFFSFNLWFDYDREIPFISILNLPYLPWINVFISLVLVLCLFFNTVRFNRFSILLSVCSIVFLFAVDRFKCQPWAYFFLTFLIISLSSSIYPKRFHFFPVRFLLAAMYFWAGFHKLSNQFLNSISYIFNSDFELVKPFFVFFPYLEIAFSLLVLFFFRSKWIVLFGVLFHISIIIFILFSNTNFIIISWNSYFVIIWISMYYTLSFKNFPFYRDWLVLTVICLFSLLPILNLYGRYNDYFSFSLYSGKIPLVFLVFPDGNSEFPNGLFIDSIVANDTAKRVLRTDLDDKVVSYYKYSIVNLNVPPVIDKDVVVVLEKHYAKKFNGCKIVLFRY